MVAPSSTATSKSSVIPMESSRRVTFGMFSAAMRSRSIRRPAKQGLALSGSSYQGAMVMSPWMDRLGIPAAIARMSPGASSGAAPLFDSSPARLTSISTRQTTPAAAARRLSSSARLTRLTEWIMSKRRTAYLALLVCRWPMKCHSTLLPMSSIFRLASWT